MCCSEAGLGNTIVRLRQQLETERSETSRVRMGKEEERNAQAKLVKRAEELESELASQKSLLTSARDESARLQTELQDARLAQEKKKVGQLTETEDWQQRCAALEQAVTTANTDARSEIVGFQNELVELHGLFDVLKEEGRRQKKQIAELERINELYR